MTPETEPAPADAEVAFGSWAEDMQRAQALASTGEKLESGQSVIEALEAYEQVLASEPDNTAALVRSARLLRWVQQPLEALARLDRALALEPELAVAWAERAEVLLLLIKFGMNRRKDAERSFRQAMALGLARDAMLYRLAAIGALGPDETVPPASPRSYVTSHFDAYAHNFEKHLVDGLKYQAHSLLVEALASFVPASSRWADAVDLGCGTGLCGAGLRPMVGRLVGVDLAGKMLAMAQRREVYDELVLADVVEYLQEHGQAYDLAVATDVLIYIGDLEPIFGAAASALRPGGLFGFSIESSRDDDRYVLNDTLRYAHGMGYVERVARAHGLAVRQHAPAALRKEGGVAVEGRIVVIQRL